MQKNRPTVGYVGLGNMGGGIAGHLAETNAFDVTVYDLRPESMNAVVEKGAEAAADLKELAEKSQTIIVCVDPADQVLKVVALLLEHLRAGRTVIIQASVPPQIVEEAATLVASTGASLFDAPVSGSHQDRLNGTLAVYVGATHEGAAENRAVLEAIGRPLYTGFMGGGQVAKLTNNAMMAITRAGVTEIMELAAAYGLSEENLRNAAAIGSGGSWVLENWEYFDEQLLSGFSLSGQAARQREEIIEIAEAKGLTLKMMEAARDHTDEIIARRYRRLTTDGAPADG